MIVELGTPPHTLCDVCLCVESRGWSTESYSLDHNESGIFWCYHRHSTYTTHICVIHCGCVWNVRRSAWSHAESFP